MGETRLDVADSESPLRHLDGKTRGGARILHARKEHRDPARGSRERMIAATRRSLASLRQACLLVSLTLAACFAAAASGAEPKPVLLEQYGIDPDRITVSGLSSGAYMAVQLGVAYSSSFRGVGVIAGGPYGCAQTGGTA